MARTVSLEIRGGMIPEREFDELRALVRQEAGISLSDAKRSLVVGRLAGRLRELGLDTYAEYNARLRSDPAERGEMLDRIATHETRFFREPRHFHHLEGTLFPAWRAEGERGDRPRTLRLWSAACSTGEEPYSLAMALLSAFPPTTGWCIEVLATDLSNRALGRAEAGLWSIDRAQDIPEPLLRRFMLRGVHDREGLMKAGPELRECVRFGRLNLVQPAYPGLGTFDAVFCRNVLMYFDAPTRERVIGQLLGHLPLGGQLFLGHAESLVTSRHPLRCIFPTVYEKVSSPPRPARAP